jgi:putative effector of murein hydrolase LrgA (UPF0299 family)
MLAGFTWLLLCQLAGEVFVRALTLPIPGPVVGMLLLFVLLALSSPLPRIVGSAADTLLQNLSLLFVPAGTGVVQHLDLLGRSGLRIMAVVVITTVLSLSVTALAFAGVSRLLGAENVGADRGEGI